MLKQSSLNAVALAFFSPLPLAQATKCNWTDMKTPCLKPARNAGAATP